ncbi:hypothetical protein XU18_2935 [Perkinsela sp. CCAP 1560/4]|nr:hypothetical protein XU18_2935 [Perkinsela sp. CCAP 1560/4]|eukprot:KNH06179.1 hypothetical protein XU18_2935 [Perkinsela sp. CCAP 1560/4]
MILRSTLRSKPIPLKSSRSQLKKLMNSIDKDFKVCDKTVSSLVRFTFVEERMLKTESTSTMAKGPLKSSEETNRSFKRRTNILCELTCDSTDEKGSYRNLLRNAVMARSGNKTYSRAMGCELNKVK